MAIQTQTVDNESISSHNSDHLHTRCLAKRSRGRRYHNGSPSEDRPASGRHRVMADSMEPLCTRSSGTQYLRDCQTDLQDRESREATPNHHKVLEKSQLGRTKLVEKETFVSNPGVHRFSSNGFQSDALGTSRRAPRSHGNHGGRGRKGSSSHSSSDKTLDGHSRSRNDPGMARKGSTLATGRQGPVDAGTREQVHVPHVAPKELLETIGWNSFFYEETTNLTAALWIKRAYAIVVLINVILLSLDWDFVQSVMPLHLGRETMDPDTLTLLEYIPEHYHKLCMYLWMLHLVGLGVDIFPRFQAFGVFFWYIQFAHSTSCLFDGEDIISRLLAFYLVFFPPKRETSWPMWPFRLVQFQMCLIYFSTGGLKLSGPSWQNGTALYKVTQEDSLYGGYWNPDWMFGYTAPLKFLTHATMCLELGGVVLIWFKETRIPTLLAIIGLHVSIDASMSLNTFHWIMIVGWCSFLVQPAEESKQLSWAWLFQTTRKFVIQLASKEKVD